MSSAKEVGLRIAHGLCLPSRLKLNTFDGLLRGRTYQRKEWLLPDFRDWPTSRCRHSVVVLLAGLTWKVRTSQLGSVSAHCCACVSRQQVLVSVSDGAHRLGTMPCRLGRWHHIAGHRTRGSGHPPWHLPLLQSTSARHAIRDNQRWRAFLYLAIVHR